MCDRRQPPPGMLTIRPRPDRRGLILAGEADLTVRDTLHAALAAPPADGAGEIHLDMAGLRFIDVACTRELIVVTSRHPAVRLIAHDPPAALLRITALLYQDARMKFTGTSRPLTPPPAARDPAPPAAPGAGCGSMPDGSPVPSPNRRTP